MALAQPATEIETKAIDCARRAVCDLVEFDAYFNGEHRFGAVDSAVMNVLRMRVEILGEHIDLLETHVDPRHEILAVLGQINAACCDFLVAWTPPGMSLL
jgi:hypothetical protein